MDKNVYLENGYVNIPYVVALPVPFIFCIGGRGTGKTYGALKYVWESGIKFLYMRRTQAQADIINRPEFSPFKSLCRDMDTQIVSRPVTKYNSAFYKAAADPEDPEKLLPDGAPIGYTLALSTVSNLRGFDMSDCKILIYDEFIPEKHDRPLKHEAAAFFNAYETINRNRELSGDAALKVMCLANANRIDNPIFSYLGILDKVNRMQKNGQAITINEKSGYAVVLLTDSPISDRKRETALYKLTAGSDFEKMAIENDYQCAFSAEKINLVEYVPYIHVGGIYIYKHKSKTVLYITSHRQQCTEVSEKLYRIKYKPVIMSLDAQNLVIYESLQIREALTKL